LNDCQPVDRRVVPADAVHMPLRGRIYAALQKLRGHALADMVAQLREWERLPVDEFHRLHRQRLAATLAHARATVPLYRTERWQQALAANPDDLDAWPVLEQDIFRAEFESLLAEPRVKRVVIRKTSGTTGQRARIALTRDADTWGWAHRYRGLLWHGIPIGVRSLRLMQDRRPLRDWLLDQRNFPALDSDGAVAEAIAYMRAARPPLVAGTPSALFFLARQLRLRGHRQPMVSFARVGGEQLFPFQRREIETYLAGRAIDSYGATETGALAGECPAGAMHVYADHVHLEIFRGDTPAPVGAFGDIVVTVLNNPAMPLVRYRVGDMGRLSATRCPCGLPQPVLLDLQARSGDILTGPDGSLHHAAELVHRFETLFEEPLAEPVRQVRFVQDDSGRWQALVDAPQLVTVDECFDPARRLIEDRLATIVRQEFGPSVGVDTRYVASLPRESGKFRYYRAAPSTRSAAQAPP
jgi:phenylacetate-CoA ligase